MRSILLIVMLLVGIIGCESKDYSKYRPQPFVVGSKVKFIEGEKQYTVIGYGSYRPSGDWGDGYWGMEIGYGEGDFRVVYKDEFNFLEQVKQ